MRVLSIFVVVNDALDSVNEAVQSIASAIIQADQTLPRIPCMAIEGNIRQQLQQPTEVVQHAIRIASRSSHQQ